MTPLPAAIAVSKLRSHTMAEMSVRSLTRAPDGNGQTDKRTNAIAVSSLYWTGKQKLRSFCGLHTATYRSHVSDNLDIPMIIPSF